MTETGRYNTLEIMEERIMDKKEIIEMIADLDGIADYVRRQMAIMPTESREKALASEKVQAVKYALVELLDEHDRKIKSLTDRIQARAAVFRVENGHDDEQVVAGGAA